jgi:hypothetical protein
MGEGEILKIIREADSLVVLSHMDVDPGLFPAVFVTREDIKGALSVDFEPENLDEEVQDRIERLTDVEMIEIASDLQDAYVAGNYWTDLECICEDLND